MHDDQTGPGLQTEQNSQEQQPQQSVPDQDAQAHRNNPSEQNQPVRLVRMSNYGVMRDKPDVRNQEVETSEQHDDSVPQDSMTLEQKIWYWALSIVGRLSILIGGYIGLTIFIYASIYLIVSPILSALGVLESENGTRMAHIILSMLCWIPVNALIMTIDLQLVVRYFKEITGIFDFKKMKEGVDAGLPFGPWTPMKYVEMTLSIASAFAAIFKTILYYIFGAGTEESAAGAGIYTGVFSLLGPVCAIYDLVLLSWKVVIRSVRPTPDDPVDEIDKFEEVELEDISHSLGEATIQNKSMAEMVESVNFDFIDPTGIRVQDEWKSFILSKCNVFGFIRARKYNWRLIVACVMLILHLARIVLDICANSRDDITHQITELRTSFNEIGLEVDKSWELEVDKYRQSNFYIYCGIILRLIINVAIIPICLIADPVQLFSYWRKINKKNIFVLTSIVSSAIVVIYIIVISIFASWQTLFEADLSGIDYEAMHSEPETVTNWSAAPICSTKIDGMSLLDISAMEVYLWSLAASDSDIFKNPLPEAIEDEIFESNMWYSDMMGDSTTYSKVWLEISNALSAVILGVDGPNDKVREIFILYNSNCPHAWWDVAILLENCVKYWYDKVIMNNIIPFFGIVSDLFLSGFLNSFVSWAEPWLLGLQSATRYEFAASVYNYALLRTVEDYIMETIFAKYIESWDIPIHRAFVGHSAGGLIMKGLANVRDDINVITFHSPVYANSRLEEVIGRNTANNRIINGYSRGCIFTDIEDDIHTNLLLPTAQKLSRPSGPVHTFCQIAAGCITTDRLDHFCGSFVGADLYEQYFDNWGRHRTVPVDRTYLPEEPYPSDGFKP